MRYKPEDLIKSLKDIYATLRRVPGKREVIKLADACEHAFGSWNNAIIAAGLEPNRSHENRMYKRIMTQAKDGHFCDSISEAIIDNWFYRNGLSHRRDVLYPTSHRKADWAINDKLFVEYFGLAQDSPRYDKDIQIKKDLCRRYGIRLIEIYPHDLYPKPKLDSKLANLT